MENFTPLSALIGGSLIGFAAILLLISTGKVAGVSSVVGGLLSKSTPDKSWRLMFTMGLLLGGSMLLLIRPSTAAVTIDTSYFGLIIAGILVGYGTRLGSGCTSGHGVCGLARLSVRSLIATVSFLGTGILTVFITSRWF